MEADDPVSEEMDIWQYDGGWTRSRGPYDWGDDETDVEGALKRAGFGHADNLGTVTPLVEIYEHKDREEWVLACCFDANKVHSIHVLGLPHVIDLLAKLGSAATASVVSDTASRLGRLISDAGARPGLRPR